MPVLVQPIRSDLGYVACGKQSVGGTSVAPNVFPRFMDGSSLMISAKAEDIWEGDGSRRLGSIVKNLQEVAIKLTIAPRPNEIGFFEVMAQGAGSDTYTAPTVSTTLSSATLVNATTASVAANTGLTGSGTIALVLSAGTAREEIAIFNIPPTGAGPYVLTVASAYNGGHLLLAHNSADTVQTAATHVITDQSDGNYYTFEVSMGGTAGSIIRVRDCKCKTLKRSAKAGSILMYELEVQGIACVAQGSAATLTFDPHPYVLFTYGVFTLDGSTSGDALAVDSFDIAQNNNPDTTIQTEQVTLAAIIFGNLGLDVGLSIIYQNGNRIAETYFGSATGTTDAQALFVGSLLLVFTLPDTLNIVTYSVPFMTYTKAEPPALKKDGKAFRQALSATSTSNFAQNQYLLQTTVANTSYAAY